MRQTLSFTGGGILISNRKTRIISVIFLIFVMISPTAAAHGILAAEDPVAGAYAGNGILEVNFIDVGVGDCIFICKDGRGMLIDAALDKAVPKIKKIIGRKNIKTLDLVIASHPHEDHISGMDSIIKSYNIGRLIMPGVSVKNKCYKDVVNAAKEKNLTVTRPQTGKKYYYLGLEYMFFAPNGSSYENINDYSVVMKLKYGSCSFLFTGDAQASSEKEMLDKGYNLKSDVLKVGHHGSATSTTDKFLKEVNPRYAVISVADGNDFGLPDKKIMKKLEKSGAKVFRTDKDGTITALCDGRKIMLAAEKRR